MKIRKTFLPIAVPDITDLEKNEVIDALDSGWISVGPKVKRMERMFAELHGTEYAVAVSSATAALFLTGKALGVGEGDRVIVPSMSWPSTANIVEQLGATPCFVDVDRRTGNITPDIVEEKILELNKDVQLITPVHMSGLPVDIRGFQKLSERYGVPVVYDAAHAVFSRYDGEPVGKFGRASCFSFYAIKNLTAGDGGVITTDDAELAEKISLWAYHGMNKDAWKRYSNENAAPHVQSIVPGYKFNMTDLNAAVGIAQLKRFDELRDRRNLLVVHYNETLSDVEGVETPVFQTDIGKWGNHVYGVRLLGDAPDRDGVMAKLAEYNIGVNIHFYPTHLHKYYRDKYPNVSLPNTEWLGERLISLPLCTRYEFEDLDYVAAALRHSLKPGAGPAKS